MKLFTLVCLALVISNGSTLTARADELIESPHVPQNVKKHYFQSDPEIQFLHSGPNFVDLRNEVPNHNLTIVIGPNQTLPATNNIVNIPGIHMNNEAPNTVQSSQQAGLPIAKFQSNISPNNSPRNILPLNKSLHSLPKPEPGILTVRSPVQPVSKIAQQTSKSTVLKYNTLGPSNSNGSRNVDVRTAVTGKLKPKPGELLNSR